jgi:hypothetical protein
MSLDLQHDSRFAPANTASAAGEIVGAEKASWAEAVVTVTLTIAAVTAVSVIAVVMGLA